LILIALNRRIGLNMGSRIAVCPGPRTGLLDHLIPLCSLLQMPLIVQDPWVQTIAEIYYPHVDVKLVTDTPLANILDDYEVLYTAESCRLYEGAYKFGEEVYHGSQRSVCGIHGNSDKFRDEYWAEQYLHEDVVLFYGEHMRTCFEHKGLLSRLKQWIRVGNYRYAYYLQRQAFFDAYMKKLLPPSQGRYRILYAPTWSYPQAKGPDDSPFFEQAASIFCVPEEVQLIVKLHPFMYRLFPTLILELQEKYAAENIVFLEDMPLIYPLLQHVDAYLGDYSSVGYDFLTMDRPLFFLAPGPLAMAGTILHDLKTLYPTLLQTVDVKHTDRQERYQFTFGDKIPLSILQERLP